jgi:hypothetical protein
MGLSLMEIRQASIRERVAREDLLVLVTFGDLIGIPILPSPYTLRLLPYWVQKVEPWKRRMLRERDLTAMGDL